MKGLMIPGGDLLSEKNDGKHNEDSCGDIDNDLVKKLKPYLDFEAIEKIIKRWG